MAYTLHYVFGLGASKTSLTLYAQIYDTTDSTTGSEITAGIYEKGNGWYGANITTIPDDHRGSIEFYESGSPATPLMGFSINPEEGEYLDQQMTTMFTTALTEAYAADGAAGTVAEILYALQAFQQERNVSSTTVTVKKLDGSTTAMSLTLDDATEPTTITRSG